MRMRMLEATSFGRVYVHYDTLCMCTWELEHGSRTFLAEGLGFRV